MYIYIFKLYTLYHDMIIYIINIHCFLYIGHKTMYLFKKNTQKFCFPWPPLIFSLPGLPGGIPRQCPRSLTFQPPGVVDIGARCHS